MDGSVLRQKRVAIYARYSSDMQKDTSIDDQIHLCKKCIKGDETLVETFTDHGISHSTLSRRTGFNSTSLFLSDLIALHATCKWPWKSTK